MDLINETEADNGIKSWIAFAARKLPLAKAFIGPADLVNKTKLDKDIKSWFAFAAQKVVEVVALAKALSGQEDRVKILDIFGTCTVLITIRTVCEDNVNYNYKLENISSSHEDLGRGYNYSLGF